MERLLRTVPPIRDEYKYSFCHFLNMLDEPSGPVPWDCKFSNIRAVQVMLVHMSPLSCEPQTMHRITVSALLPECEETPPHELELPEDEYEYTLVDCKVDAVDEGEDALGAARAKTKL
jgi:hypothetical protein